MQKTWLYLTASKMKVLYLAGSQSPACCCEIHIVGDIANKNQKIQDEGALFQQLQCSLSCIYLDVACGFGYFCIPVVFSNSVDCGSVEQSHLHELLCPVLFRTALSSSVLLNFHW